VKKDESEEEKWYRAYSILFPYDDPTAYPSPCRIDEHEKVFNADLI
jgi:hypothetical protein